MRATLLLLGCVVVCLQARTAGAAPPPALDALTRGEPVALDAGTLTAGYWRGIRQFPRVVELKWGAGAGVVEGGKLLMGKGMAAVFAEEGGGLRLKNNGWYEKDPQAFAPMVVFEPARPGVFKVSGTLTLVGGKGEEGTLQWSVFRIRADQSIDVVTLGRGKRGDVIELAGQSGYGNQTLDAVALAEGERMALTAWHAGMYESGGAVLRGLTVAVSDKPAPPPPTPLPKPAPSDADRRFPPGAGPVDVTQPPYHAKGDGVTDDTDALQLAMSEHNRGTVFLPNGTYLVSRQLRWQTKKGDRISHLMLLGESREGTVIKLQDRCPMYDDVDGDPMDTSAPAVLRTESDMGPPDAAIENFIRNLTVDTGKGNPGAVGISFLGNNIAAVEDVTIRSGDGAGRVGLSMIRIPGPALVKNVSVAGFDYAAAMREVVYNMTLDGFTMKGQRKAGILNPAAMLTIHDLRSDNTVPALVNTASKHPNATAENPLPPIRYAMTQLINAKLVGGASDQPAIVNSAHLYARDVQAQGYRVALNHEGQDVPGSTIDEFTGDFVLRLWDDAPHRALRLPIKPTPPEFHTNDFAQWASPTDFTNLYHQPHEPTPAPGGAAVEVDPKKTYDHTAAIQAALDAGRPIVYLPRGKYFVSAPLRVPPHVRRIAGMRSTLELRDGPTDAFGDPTNPRPMLHVTGDTDEPLSIDFVIHKGGNGRSRGGAWGILHDSKRPLVLRHNLISGYRNTAGAGPLFVENNCATQYHIAHPAEAYFKQFDPEGQALRIWNNGGRVSILGLKIEGGQTVVRTTGGGQTEVIGAFLRPSAGYPMDAPAFESIDSQMSVIACVMSWGDQRFGPRRDRDYHDYIRETRGGETRALTRDDLEARGLIARTAGVVPLFVGFSDDTYRPAPLAMPLGVERVPSPWRLRDLGRPNDAGEARFFADGALIELSGMGRYPAVRELRRGIGDEEDAGGFLHADLPGDGAATVRLGSFTHTYGPQLKAGVMLRQSLDAAAPAAFVGAHIHPGPNKTRLHEVVLLVRDQPGTQAQRVAAIEAQWPIHVRLERKGGRVLASTSADGAQWTELGAAPDPTRGAALLGAAVAGENGTHAATAVLENLTIRGSGGDTIAGPPVSPVAPWLAFDTAPIEPGYALLFPGRTVRTGPDAFALTGSGWAFDSREYAHALSQVVPDGTQAVAKVTWENPADLPKAAKAGLAVREGPGFAGVKRFNLSITPTEVYLENRIPDKPVGQREPRSGEGLWLKIAAKDNALFAYTSEDGEAWKLVGSQAYKNFPDAFTMGLFTTSGILQRQSTARFEHVRLGPAEVPAADVEAARE